MMVSRHGATGERLVVLFGYMVPLVPLHQPPSCTSPHEHKWL